MPPFAPTRFRSIPAPLLFLCISSVVALIPAPVSAQETLPGLTRPLRDDASVPQRINADFQLADGAAWDGAGRLFVPDVKAKRLLQFNLRRPEEEPKLLLEGTAISGTCYQLGRLYISDNRGARIATLNPQNKLQTLAQFDAKERPNDLVIDAQGNVFVTITSIGVVRRVSPDGKLKDVASGIVTPNGIALSPSGKQLYVSSAKTGVVHRVDLTDELNAQESAVPFAQLPETDDGFRGDGMCVDRAGNVYVTGAKATIVYSPEGQRVDTIKTPERPINVVIGGVDARTLFISTFGGLYQLPLNRYGVSPNRNDQDGTRDDTHTRISPNLEARFNLVYLKDGPRELLMDVFRPKSDRPSPAVVVVHGGGWKNGDKTKFRALALRLAERGYVTAAIEYRLSGEARFPAGIRDCNAATAYLRKHADEWGIDPDRIAAVGGSAGGHLVGLMAAGASSRETKHAGWKDDDSSLAAAVVMAGPLEIASGSVAERSLTSAASSNSVLWMDGNVREKADLYHLADAAEKVDGGTPPMLFLCGSLDQPERNTKTREKMDALKIPNRLVVHKDAKHGHWNRADWIGRVVDDIDSFLKQQL